MLSMLSTKLQLQLDLRFDNYNNHCQVALMSKPVDLVNVVVAVSYCLYSYPRLLQIQVMVAQDSLKLFHKIIVKLHNSQTIHKDLTYKRITVIVTFVHASYVQVTNLNKYIMALTKSNVLSKFTLKFQLLFKMLFRFMPPFSDIVSHF